jgi:putative membrane protein
MQSYGRGYKPVPADAVAGAAVTVKPADAAARINNLLNSGGGLTPSDLHLPFCNKMMMWTGRAGMSEKNFHRGLLLSLAGVFIWSVINPHDVLTWFLEVLPAIIGVAILVATYDSFKFTNLSYSLLWLHAIILIIGGHYTYAEMPLFNWLRDTFDLSRNYYDRLGHFAQGFVPAIIAREILVRKSPLEGGKWLAFIVVSICLAISASYELIEFGVALVSGTAADAFLGTQGDVWDTQWDMLFALCGASIALLTLSKYHDRLLVGKTHKDYTVGL